MKKKFAVMVEGKSSPSRLHDTYDSAVKEAERLTRLEGKPAYILQPICKIQTTILITTL